MQNKVDFLKKAVFFGFAICLFFFTAHLQANPGSEQPLSKLESIKKAGKLVVGTSTDYPPYEFHLLNDKEGDIVGLDISIAREISTELGVKLEIKDVVFHRIFDILDSGEVDMVIAGLAPSERRKQAVDFSDVYYQAIQNMVIRAEDSEHIIYLRDLRGKIVGTQKGSIQEDLVVKQIIGAEFVVKETVDELIEDLKNKKIDVAILEKPVAESYVMRNKDLINIECQSNAGAFDSLLGSAIAIKKGNPDFLVEINRILQKLKDENKIIEFVEDAKILMNK